MFLDKCLKALNSDTVKFSDGRWPPEILSYEGKAVSSNLTFIKDKSSSRNLGIVIQKVVKILNIQST